MEKTATLGETHFIFSLFDFNFLDAKNLVCEIKNSHNPNTDKKKMISFLKWKNLICSRAFFRIFMNESFVSLQKDQDPMSNVINNDIEIKFLFSSNKFQIT